MSFNNDDIISMKCPYCSSNDIKLDSSTGKLKCNYCGKLIESDKFDEDISNIDSLSGEQINSSAYNISSNDSKKKMIVLECSNCGADIVIDSNQEYGKCHWCNTLLTSSKIIDKLKAPDRILPFKITKEQAQNVILNFFSTRKKYAKTNYKKNFNVENISGVYLPYMLVDANCSCDFEGIGEHLIKYDNYDKYIEYLVECHSVKRKFDILIDDVMLEANKSKKYKSNEKNSTNYVISLIGPFDTEECVKYKPNYLEGFTSEKRDMNVEELTGELEKKVKSISKYAVRDSLDYYKRGVRWEKQDVDIKGTKWVTAYLPVWIYSYYEKKSGKNIIHYIAVNGRNGNVAGSIPPKKIAVAIKSVILALITSLLLFAFFYFITFNYGMEKISETFKFIRILFCYIVPVFVFIVVFLSTYSMTINDYSGKKTNFIRSNFKKNKVYNMVGEDIKLKEYKTSYNHLKNRNDDDYNEF